MTTQAIPANHAADISGEPGGASLPENSELTLLVNELARCREALTRGQAALMAAVSDDADAGGPSTLAEIVQDLEAAADRVTRAERLAEAEASGALKRQGNSEALAARLEAAQAHVKRLKARLESAPASPAPTPSPAATAPVRSLKGRLRHAARRWRRKLVAKPALMRPPTDAEAAAAIEASGLFDAGWYLAKYADVRDAGAAPLEHFLRHGGAEGRKPGPGFDTRWYVAQSEEISKSGLNPLVHYALYGRAAGLRPMNGELGPEDDLDVALLLASPLFNADDYRARNPGIGKGRHKVAKHYLDTGWRLGSSPGPDFDGQRYLDRHRDVRDAGVNPLVHYLRHGRDEGREIFSTAKPAGQIHERSDAEATGKASSVKFGAENAQPWAWTRFADLEILKSTDGALRLGDLTIGVSRPRDQAAITAVLATFEALARPGAGALGERARFSSTQGPVVVDAWFVTSTTLRLRLAQTAGYASVVRCFQSASGRGDFILLTEQAVRTEGLPLIDVDLENAYASLLVTVDDGAGEVSTACVVAFPSLARNGDHHAELSASRQGAGPGALVAYGALLGSEWLAGAETGDLSLGGIELDLAGAIGGERILTSPLLSWVRGRMGVDVAAAPSSPADDSALAVLRAQVAAINEKTPLAPRRSRGMVLAIHGDEAPTLQALVSRNLPRTRERSAALIVADVVRGKPRWLVTPPSSGPDLSRLQPAGLQATWPCVKGSAGPASHDHQATFPIAIRYQETSAFDQEAGLLFPRAPDSVTPVLAHPLPASLIESPVISLILSVDPDIEVTAALATLSSVMGQKGRLIKDVIILLREPRPEFVTEAEAIAPHMTVLVEPGRAGGVNRAATLASGAYLLIMDAGVVLHDRRTLEALLTLAASPGAASASCATLEQAGARDSHKARWFSGGVFPTHIDLLGAPGLAFGEPQSPAALPQATYAVACNRMRLALVPAEQWSLLGGLDEAAFPHRDYDLDLALRALETGAAHLCTTAVTALLLTEISWGGSNDPGSSAMVSPSDWGLALARMTLLRNLG